MPSTQIPAKKNATQIVCHPGPRFALLATGFLLAGVYLLIQPDPVSDTPLASRMGYGCLVLGMASLWMKLYPRIIATETGLRWRAWNGWRFSR